MKYFPTNTTEEQSKQISHKMWLLTKPQSTNNSETTQYYVSTKINPENSGVYFPMPDSEYRIHAEADIDGYIESWSGAYSKTQLNTVKKNLKEATGTSVEIEKLFPSSSVKNALDVLPDPLEDDALEAEIVEES
jgi:hypothetical protein